MLSPLKTAITRVAVVGEVDEVVVRKCGLRSLQNPYAANAAVKSTNQVV